MNLRDRLAEIIGHQPGCEANYKGSCDCGTTVTVILLTEVIKEWGQEIITDVCLGKSSYEADILYNSGFFEAAEGIEKEFENI